MRGAFRRAWTGPILSREQSARQGRVAKAAAEALADTDAVRTFLNSHHAGLGGRPLDLAVESDAGLEAVEKAIRIEAERRPQPARTRAKVAMATSEAQHA